MLPEYLQYKTYTGLYSDGKTPKTQVAEYDGKRFSVLSPYLIRIEAGVFTDRPTQVVLRRSFGSVGMRSKVENGVLTVETDGLTLTYKGGDFAPETLSIRLKTKPYTEWHYGEKPLQNLGGTVSTLDQINGACELGDGVCSIDGYALIDDSKSALFTDDGWFETRDPGCFDLYFFGHGHDYEGAVKDYYRLTGIPELLPAYALGNWWSRYFKYTEESYLALMDKFKEEDVPIAVGIIDMDWHLTDGDGREYVADGWTGYTWNKELFPDPKRFLQGLKARNIRTALNLHPAAGVRPWDDDYEEMATRMGIDPATKHPVPFNCLSKKFWKAYFEVLHFPKEADGVSFWWMDWQQGTDYQWMHFYDPKKDPLECLNPLWMLGHFHFLASKRGGKRGLFFSRYAGYGSQRYPVGFSGDNVITWESLNFQPYFTATASNIGYGFWSHDLGGHMMGYRDDELNARWIQFGVFSPIFRIHSSNSPFTVREPWNFRKDVADTLKSFMQLRHQLFPYLYTMCYRNYSELIPLMRPLYHVNPENKEAYAHGNEYWFGSELIAAPITEKADAVTGRGHAKVWLPDGRWVDWFTGFVYEGNETIDVFRPIEQMPLFCKPGAIVPLQAHIPHGNALGGAGQMEIAVAAGADNVFTLYEDDGEKMPTAENSCTTRMELRFTETKAVFTVSAAEGNRALIPENRTYVLHCKGFSPDAKFNRNGKALAAVRDEKTGEWTVSVGDAETSVGFTVEMISESGLSGRNENFRDRLTDLLMHSNMENNFKGTWNWIVNEQINGGWFDPTAFVTAPGNRLGDALAEIIKQVVRKKKPVPTPGLPH